MRLTMTQTKDFRCRQQCAFRQCSYPCLSGCYFVHWPLLLLTTSGDNQSFRLQGRGSAGQAGAKWRTEQDRRTGYKNMSLYGQTLDWHGRGQLSGAKVVYGLLSAGTHGQPDPVHLVDDFQRTNQDKPCVYVCACV